MTDALPSQLASSELLEQSSIELTYPQIPVPSSFADLLSYSAPTKMANESQSDHQETALSESWATLSEADYSFDDDLRSETTDAASLVDNTGADDVHSIDDRTSDASSQDDYSDKHMSQELPPQKVLVESTKTLGPESGGPARASRSGRPIELERAESQIEAEFAEATQVIHSFSHEEVDEVTQYTLNSDEHSQFVGSVCMTISKNSLELKRPLRLLYIGDTSARAEILTKIGDVLMADPGTQRSRRQLDSSRYHVVLASDASDSSSNHPDLIPIKTQIVVDDCTSAASIKHEQAPDQIFLSFKNGSLYSSRWNGTTYEVSSASEWSTPDLAVFFVAHDDHPMVKQRHQLAHAFVSRHRIPALIISETTTWTSRFNDLPIDHQAPHLRIQARLEQTPGGCLTLRLLPIDLETFESLESDQLNKNFAYLCNRTSAEVNINPSGHASAPSHGGPGKSPMWRGVASDHNLQKPISWYAFCTDTPLLATIILAAGGLISLAMGIVVCKFALALFVYLSSLAGDVSRLSPATTWSPSPSSAPIILATAPSVIQTTGAAVVTSNKVVSKSLATMDIPSDLAELVTSKSLHATNKSENFQVHGIGNCHIVVKTPRGFKTRNRSIPFDVIVARGVQVLDSSLSELFDGVYTVRVDGGEAHGLLNVTIRRHKSSVLEEHLVDFGPQWLKAAGWKKAVQIASEQVRTDLDTAQVALSTAYDQLSEDMHLKAKGISSKAARQAKKFSLLSRLFLNSTAELLKAKSHQLRHATKHERQEAYRALNKRADLAFQALVVYAHTTNEQGRAFVERILVSAGQNAPSIDLVDLQNKMQESMRSERLAKAQERAKQIVKDTSSSWRQRKASRKAQRAGCGKKGRACNR